MQFARQRQVAFQALFLAGNFLVQPGIFNRDRDLSRQRGDRALVVVGKESALGVLQIEHADDFVFVDQRHRQFRAGLRIQQDVARIFADVGHQHGLPVTRGISHQAIAQRNVVLELNVFLKAQREPVLQFLSRRIQQQDAEHLVVDQAAEQFGNALEQFIHVQNGGELARDLVQQNQRPRLACGAGVQAGILDSHRHARADQRQQPLVFFGEAAGFVRLQIQHADDPILDDQRNRQLRAHVGSARDVLGMLRHVVDQDGLAPLRRQPGDALANLDLYPLGNFARISHLEADAQVLCLLIHQQDGKDLVVDDFAHQFGHAAQRGVQIERGIDDVRHLEQQEARLSTVRIESKQFPQVLVFENVNDNSQSM